MFVTVQFGEGHSEIFNTNCRVINFIHCLKERCSLDTEECVDLVDKTGELVNLSDREQSAERANYLMRDRHTYILIRVIRGDGTEGHKYEPLLRDLGKNYPELADLLKKLSNPHKEKDKKNPSRRGLPQRDTPTNHTPRSKRATSPRKSSTVTLRN
ncbi:hypothetical protein COCON_G00157610 [Conger conger]|uniref:Uncharacterized protein n=1 Tax=Conger conger TaxID=82655 RepID=A0A9Q1HUG1_CONCO|nr:uncharacterized protein C22orf15 [Conger conger]KAJ8263304.1 hypothetical protein COCON_G00157610 [Conger conger]